MDRGDGGGGLQPPRFFDRFFKVFNRCLELIKILFYYNMDSSNVCKSLNYLAFYDYGFTDFFKV